MTFTFAAWSSSTTTAWLGPTWTSEWRNCTTDLLPLLPDALEGLSVGLHVHDPAGGAVALRPGARGRLELRPMGHRAFAVTVVRILVGRHSRVSMLRTLGCGRIGTSG